VVVDDFKLVQISVVEDGGEPINLAGAIKGSVHWFQQPAFSFCEVYYCEHHVPSGRLPVVKRLDEKPFFILNSKKTLDTINMGDSVLLPYVNLDNLIDLGFAIDSLIHMAKVYCIHQNEKIVCLHSFQEREGTYGEFCLGISFGGIAPQNQKGRHGYGVSMTVWRPIGYGNSGKLKECTDKFLKEQQDRKTPAPSYQEIGCKLFTVDKLPQGALPKWGNKPKT